MSDEEKRKLQNHWFSVHLRDMADICYEEERSALDWQRRAERAETRLEYVFAALKRLLYRDDAARRWVLDDAALEAEDIGRELKARLNDGEEMIP